ncbi:hypothetical protein J2S09_000072 [Bacillus fengqiuensis]|nr:hypothetical protein [Bacillus fengqiuensis]
MLKTEKILVNSRIVQSEGNVVCDMDGEKVMLNITKGKYYNLGELGGAIWELINTPIEVNEIITSLLYEYDVEKVECEQQVLSFVHSLHEEGLIQVITEE